MFTKTDLQRLTDVQSFLSLSDREFEYCCKFLLEQAGYGKVFVTKKGPKGGDGGIDLDIFSADRKLVACGQCKLWKVRYGGLMKPVRELYGSMKLKGASRGVFIVTAKATLAEKRDAELLNIEMIDAPALVELVREYAASQKQISMQTPKAVPALSDFAMEQKQKQSHSFCKTIVKVAFAVIGFLLLVVGYAIAGAAMILIALLTLGIKEMQKGNRYNHHGRRYRRRGYSF